MLRTLSLLAILALLLGLGRRAGRGDEEDDREDDGPPQGWTARRHRSQAKTMPA